MGRAGQSLKQVMEVNDIDQHQLASALDVQSFTISKWCSNELDITADMITKIIQELSYLNRNASNEFISLYLGDLVLESQQICSEPLPLSDNVNVQILTQLFDKTTNSYKYLYFLSLLDIIKRNSFREDNQISFREMAIEVLSNAWYPNKYHKLSFGQQDQISRNLEFINFDSSQTILKYGEADKKLLRSTISGQLIESITDEVNRYVPYRLIRPFFSQELRGFKDHSINAMIIELCKHKFDKNLPFYSFKFDLDNSYLVLHGEWVKYFEKNYMIVKNWASWEWLRYIQQKNPSVPNIINKLFIPKFRESLIAQTKYWKSILEKKTIFCIYSNMLLRQDEVSLDHYLPWSFVAHNQLWNLIPTTKSVNSSKSNKLPDQKYFYDFIKLQHLGLNTYMQKVPRQKWLIDVESFITELKVSHPDDLLSLEILTKAYEVNVKPLISLAEIQGFTKNWIYNL